MILQHKEHHWRKELHKVVKNALGFEKQKLVRSIRQMQHKSEVLSANKPDSRNARKAANKLTRLQERLNVTKVIISIGKLPNSISVVICGFFSGSDSER